MASSGRINVGLSVGANCMTPHRRSCVNCRAEAGVWSTVTVASAAGWMPGNPIGIWDMSPGFRAAWNIRRVAKAFKKGSWWIPGSWMCRWRPTHLLSPFPQVQGVVVMCEDFCPARVQAYVVTEISAMMQPLAKLAEGVPHGGCDAANQSRGSLPFGAGGDTQAQRGSAH